MRRISAHFALSPDHRFLHMPVLQLDNDNHVVGLHEAGASFTETAGVEFYNGLIIPGLIGVLPQSKLQDSAFQSRMCRNGVLFLLSLTNVTIRSASGYPVVIEKSLEDSDLNCDDDCFVWEKLMERLKQGERVDASAWLLEYLIQPWAKSGCAVGGAFVEGKRPGVLQITGMDWQTMQFTDKTQLRLIL